MSNFKLPGKKEINAVFSSFSKKEWWLFVVFALAFSVATLTILEHYNKMLMVSVPLHGGSISEGVVGTPRFINPILANSLVDQDLTKLVYSGLMRKSADGTLAPDLAERYEVSKDGLTYTFVLKDDVTFQNGTPVTADDIVFTIDSIKDEVIKSPRKIEWDGISTEKLDDKTVRFTLRQSYASFLENCTIGIMPMALWKGSPVELNKANTEPVGSGPYMVKNISKQSSGSINSYELTPFKKFILGQPYIKKLTLHFYNNQDDMIKALKDGEVSQISSITPSNAEKLKEEGYQIDSSVLPRVFGLFFNQNQNQIFLDKNVIKAIDQAIDKDKIIKEVLYGYGVAISDPIPPNLIAYQKLSLATATSHENNVEQIKATLAKAGWVKGEDGYLEKTTTDSKKKKTTTKIEFSISTGNSPELAQAANLIQQDLEEIGMKVDVKTFEVGNLNQGVIRPRKYDALLFGQIINHESDLFAFWHSSQRKDPGLNVAMYANAKVDKILEDAFVTADEETRIKKYAQFEDEIRKDMPAVFIYSPDFVYVVSNKLKGLAIDHITSPGDRFSNIYSWYTDTEDVWKIFVNN